MSDNLGPLDPDIAALLAGERESPQGGPDPQAHGRVGGRLAATLGIPLLIPGGPFGPDLADPSGVDPSALDPSALDPSALDPSALDPSALLDPSLLDPSAVLAGKAAVGKAAVAVVAGKTAAATTAAAAAGTTAAAATTAAAGTAAVAAGTGASAAAGAGLMALITKPLLLGTFVAGTMVGGTTVAVVQPALQAAPEPKIVYVPQTPPPQASANFSEAAIADDDELAEEVERAPAPAPQKVVPRRIAKKMVAKVDPVAAPEDDDTEGRDAESGRDNALAQENALVQMARTSLQRQKHAQALTALNDHRRTFPNGKLSEERDALAIFSLIGLGRIDDAKGAARQFERAYPKSIFASPVKSALKGR